MSQGIMERNLPVAESIGEGDKVRIVTSAGNSKNIDASQIGGGAFLICNYDESDMSIDKTYNQIVSAVNNGVIPIVRCVTNGVTPNTGNVYTAYFTGAFESPDDYRVDFSTYTSKGLETSGLTFKATSKTGTMTTEDIVPWD